MSQPGLASDPVDIKPQGFGSRDVPGVGDDLLVGLAPHVICHHHPVTLGNHPIQRCRDLDQSADHHGIYTVVAGIEAYIIIASQSDLPTEPGRWRMRW